VLNFGVCRSFVYRWYRVFGYKNVIRYGECLLSDKGKYFFNSLHCGRLSSAINPLKMKDIGLI
jgi:hypothetical protein